MFSLPLNDLESYTNWESGEEKKYKQLSEPAESPCYMLASIYMEAEYHSVLEAERVSRFKIATRKK